MPRVRQLIEHLDVTGDYHQFALEADMFGDDLLQTWTGIENGAHLLWLAAAVGVEPEHIIATACELLADVFEQIESAGWETAQVLEAVHKWQRGELLAEEVGRSGWPAYALIARMSADHPLSPAANEVADAAVWLTHLVRDSPSSPSSDLAEHDPVLWCGSAWMMVNCLAQALAYQQHPNDTVLDEYARQRACEMAMHHLAILVREHIAGTEVETAARQRGLWSGC